MLYFSLRMLVFIFFFLQFLKVYDSRVFGEVRSPAPAPTPTPTPILGNIGVCLSGDSEIEIFS